MLDAYKYDEILPGSLKKRRFKVPESILHHPFTAPSALISTRSLMYHDQQYSHGITRSLFKDPEIHDLVPDIQPDWTKIKEPLDKIGIEVLDYPSRHYEDNGAA